MSLASAITSGGSDDGKLSVLILDDDAEMRKYLSSVFDSLGCSVQTVGKIKSLKSHLKHAPDVVAVDLMMPERDGVQVLEAMAKANLESAVVIISGCPDRILSAAENYARMSGLRVLGALRKPIWRDKVKEILEPLRHQGKHTKPHLEEQEFFRLMETGHLATHYEPIVDAQRAAVHGLEAVARVQHPKLGIMSPTGMWDTAEAYGASQRIKYELLKSAIKDAARFSKEGLRLVMGCEIPSAELKRSDFADEFLGMCRSANVLPSSMCINITEADMRQDFIPALGTLTRLALRGVQLSVDDYGTGSLTGGMIARLPVNEMKLAASLSAATLRDSDARCRILDIVAYSSRHDFRIVAKNVENEEHLGLLMDLGVTFFQGKVIEPPKGYSETLYWIQNSAKHLSDLGMTSNLRGKAVS